MPEVALAVGQVGVDRGVIQVNDFLSGIALVVLGHGVGQRQRDRRAVALHDVADALVDDLLEHRERFLRGELVVKADDLELRPAGPVLLVGEVGDVLPAVQLVLAHRGHEAGQRVDETDFHGLRLCTKCEQGGGGAKGGRADEAIHCLLLLVWGGSVLVGDLQHCFAAGRCFPMQVMVVKPGGRVKRSARRAGLYLFFPKAALKTVIEETA